MKPTVPELLDKLVTHGSVEQIVNYLVQEGVLGEREDDTTCVIANYVSTRTDVKVIHVLPNGPGYCHRQNPAVKWLTADGAVVGKLPLPDVLNELALRFDNDEFPELVAEEEEV